AVELYDTTLRDGTQAENFNLSVEDKIRITVSLDKLGIDYIEGGWPGSNPLYADFFKEAKKIKWKNSEIIAFCSTRYKKNKVHQDPNLLATVKSGVKTTVIFGKSWDMHVRDILGVSLKENLEIIKSSVSFLTKKGLKVIFDAEHFFDGYKDDPEFAIKALESAVSAGADACVLCDTNGGTMPHEIYEITESVISAVGGVIGIHTHNDSGMAVANAVESIRAGATHVQGTINGYGERCGNSSLCTLIPTLELKLGKSCLPKGKLKEMRDVSLHVDDLVNFRHDSKLPYVGKSAFAHKGGAHVNAVKKNPHTFEHIEPELVGNERHILVSELSGGSNVLLKAVELGIGRKESEEGAKEILASLKEMEAKGYSFESADASFKILIQKVLKKHKSFFDLEGFRVIIDKRNKDESCVTQASVKVRVGDDVEHTVAEGDGPVDALNHALRKALTRFYPSIADVALKDFKVRILDPQEATAAITQVLIESGDGQEVWGTVGVSDNLIEASWEALVDSVEYKLFRDEQKK
ncbi:MAG: citramalate synthase, partial [Kiritimatiellae bacterium]|nr:citramalate synthase [Kiritimatiellia bacterium]